MSSRFGSKTDGGIIRDFIESYDGDAANYFAVNTAIVSEADKRAINDFYLGLKSDGIYTKIKAMYLPIWGSAATCKWNLVNPLDTNGAFRLNFATGWTFSSSGITPLNAYAQTYFIPSSNLTLYNSHMAFYSRTSSFGTGGKAWMGVSENTNIYDAKERFLLSSNSTGPTLSAVQPSSVVTTEFATTTSQANRLGFFINNRTSATATTLKLWKNGIAIANATTNATGTALNNAQIYIGAMRSGTVANPYADAFNDGQGSFISIGTGLTDTEAVNFSNRVNTLMAYFGINTYPVVSDADAQAYINANEAITSQSDANAINTFFTGLKSDGIYTKIKAMYLPIWGSAATCKWNLVNNRTFDLTFSVNWLYTSQGILGDGASTWANTNLVPSTSGIQLYNGHLSAYSQTSAKPTAAADFFLGTASNSGTWTNLEYFGLYTSPSVSASVQHSSLLTTDYVATSYTNRLGFWINSRTSSTATTLKLFKNGVSQGNATTSSAGQALNIYSIYLGALRNMTDFSPYAGYFTNSKISFASIGDGLTDTEALNFSNRVNTLMSYFGINQY